MLSDSHRPFVMVLTKTDKVIENQKRLEEITNEMKTAGTLCSPIIHATCAADGFGVHELMANLIYMLSMPILRKPT